MPRADRAPKSTEHSRQQGATPWRYERSGGPSNWSGTRPATWTSRSNGLTADDLISIWFTATPDLHSDFPAAAARKLGIVDVPLICAQELDIEGGMPRVVRVLAHIESDKPRADIAHVYLGAAAALRKDIAQ
jgi:chorismate mutase